MSKYWGKYMRYCPLIREKCKGAECTFWLDKIPEEGNKCAIYWIGLHYQHQSRLEECMPSPQNFKAYHEKALKILSERSIEEIAKEALEFVKKNYPEFLETGYIPPEAFNYFWADKGIPQTIFYENQELDLIREKIEAKVQLDLHKELEKQDKELEERKKAIVSEIEKSIKAVENTQVKEDITSGRMEAISEREKHPLEDVLKKLREKSPQELAEELIQFIEKEFPEIIELKEVAYLHEAKRFFWMKKGLREEYVEDPDVDLKMRRAELLAEKKIMSKIYSEEKVTSETTSKMPEEITKKEKEIEEAIKIPEEITKKSEEELANELVEFIKGFIEKGLSRELPSPIQYYQISHQVSDLFWEQKGVKRYQVDSATRLKITKVETLAFERLEKEFQELEKEIISKLADECVLWARKHGLRKVTKSNTNYFLTEKGVRLSTASKDALYNLVNIRLHGRKY
jgi:hypothetical protein